MDMNDKTRAGIIAFMAAVAVLAGCGGGGGGGGGSPAAAAAWGQQAYAKAANTDAADQYGVAVALGSDTLVVGAQGEASNQNTITNGTSASSNNGAAGAGAVFVYTRSGTAWSQQAYLKAPNAQAGDNFGSAVAIDGDTIVVGAPAEDSNQTSVSNGTTASGDNSSAASGAAYVFRRTAGSWAQEAYLKGSAIAAGANFGFAVAISGDTIVVGAHGENSSTGAAYVFKRSGTTWSEEQRLTAVNGGGGDDFGTSVGISGDTIVVGAIGESSSQASVTNGATASADESAANAGAAYVYKRSGTTWTQEAYLKANNSEAGDFFGRSVAISGDTVLVGADGEAGTQGAVYAFTRSGTTWSQQAYLKASNATGGHNFGASVGLYGNTAAIGADGVSSSAGATYVFSRSGTTWSQAAYLRAANTDSSDYMGAAVAVYGSTVAAGAAGEASNQTTITNGATASSDNTLGSAGAAYVYTYQ
jgi:hypothetical protein